MALYVISTPIGNLKDITQRAVDVLTSIDTLVCEDTRRAGLLLKNLKIKNKPKLIPLNAFNEGQKDKIQNILNRVEEGKEIGLISNAGTPLISDPGYKLVHEAKKQGIKVIPIPGPSSILAALVASGFPTDKFTFLGFFPKKEGQLTKLFQTCKQKPKHTYIAFESPYRIVKTLQIIQNSLGNIEICVAKELTKIHESIETKRVGEHLELFQNTKPKGEYVLIFQSTS